MQVKFNPKGSLWSRRWHLLAATLLHPGLWRHVGPQNSRQLLPGYGVARSTWHALRGKPPVLQT